MMQQYIDFDFLARSVRGMVDRPRWLRANPPAPGSTGKKNYSRTARWTVKVDIIDELCNDDVMFSAGLSTNE